MARQSLLTMKPRPISWCIAPDGEHSFSEKAYRISLQDEGGGEYVEVEDAAGKIGINPEDWPHLKEAIELALQHCREDHPGEPT